MTDPPTEPATDAEQAEDADLSSEAKRAVEQDLHRYVAPVVGPDDPRVITDSGIEVDRLYDESDVAPGLEERLGEPGAYPFTRGIHEGMYRDRLWTMRQYAGFSSPEDTNGRYRYLLEHGSTGLSMAFDLPTQLGRDSDDPLCEGEVGRTGVPIDTIEDMRICFDEIPLDQVSTSMTINAPAAILLLLYELVGEEQGVPPEKLRGTVQNDVLKEYVARGNYIYPPVPTMRLTTDIFEYCAERIPKWNTISISGYHIREKGCSAVQEVAFTLSNAIAYTEAALDRGLEIDEFAPRLAFFFNGHNNVFQEIAKFRAVRRMWAKIVRDRFGSESERSQMIRFHTQTGGVTLQAQQPEVNIIRVALQGFAAVCGGTQSLHTNGFDEALALPTERSARIALRTQQVIAHESGAADTVDPFAGSYFVESLTDEIEERSWELIEKVGELGGSVEALDFIQREIEESALSYHERYRTGQDIVVGVNEYVTDTVDDVDILKVDPEAERRQNERLAKFKANRDQAAGRAQTRGAARGRPRRRQPAAADPRGAGRRGLDRRGLQRDARRVRRVQGWRVLLALRSSGPPPSPDRRRRARGARRREPRLEWRRRVDCQLAHPRRRTRDRRPQPRRERPRPPRGRLRTGRLACLRSGRRACRRGDDRVQPRVDIHARRAHLADGDAEPRPQRRPGAPQRAPDRGLAAALQVHPGDDRYGLSDLPATRRRDGCSDRGAFVRLRRSQVEQAGCDGPGAAAALLWFRLRPSANRERVHGPRRPRLRPRRPAGDRAPRLCRRPRGLRFALPRGRHLQRRAPVRRGNRGRHPAGRRPVAAIWIVVLPALLYGAWWLYAQGLEGDPQSQTNLINLLTLPSWAFQSLSALLGAVTGLDYDYSGGSSPLVAGPTLAVIAVLALGWRLSKGRISSWFWAALGVVISLWVMGVLAAGFVRQPDDSRYLTPLMVSVFAVAAWRRPVPGGRVAGSRACSASRRSDC